MVWTPERKDAAPDECRCCTGWAYTEWRDVMQMQEKIMVTDTLNGINGELTRYAGMIAQTENKELKQTLKQFRNTCEQSQEELYQIAREKSYYVPASQATAEEVAHVKELFTQGTL